VNVAQIIHEATVIAETLEAIDLRCLAADGPVTPTLSEATPDELRRMYKSADRIRRETAAGKKKGGGR
jgi:hypothetical protein